MKEVKIFARKKHAQKCTGIRKRGDDIRTAKIDRARLDALDD